MESAGVNMTLFTKFYVILKLSSQANAPLVIDFHVWKNDLRNIRSVCLLAGFKMLHVQTPHNLCMFSSENYIIG